MHFLWKLSSAETLKLVVSLLVYIQQKDQSNSTHQAKKPEFYSLIKNQVILNFKFMPMVKHLYLFSFR